jgi:hypothetical protein
MDEAKYHPACFKVCPGAGDANRGTCYKYHFFLENICFIHFMLVLRNLSVLGDG